MQISLIAAMAANRVIGNENQLPWHLPADLKFFREHTINKPVIMGRRTFESVGVPLPKRRNIIISRNKDYQQDGCIVVPNRQEAIAACDDAPEVMIVGGTGIYKLFLPIANRIYLTIIHGEFEGDTFFPMIDEKDWQEIAREDHEGDAENPYDYSFVEYGRQESNV